MTRRASCSVTDVSLNTCEKQVLVNSDAFSCYLESCFLKHSLEPVAHLINHLPLLERKGFPLNYARIHLDL